MKSYKLAALLKVRTIHQEKALCELVKAKETHERERKAKKKIEDAIAHNRLIRKEGYARLLTTDIFSKKTSLFGFYSRMQKNLIDEEEQLKKSLIRQDKILKNAASHEDQKLALFRIAERETKVIDKHREKWQHEMMIAEEKKVDIENDDFNAARFKIRLKA